MTVLTISAPAQEKRPVDYVDPFIGTSNSRWVLFPGVTMPNGMVKLSPDNQGEVWQGGYDYSIGSIHGFSHLHGWTMGGLITMPANGDLALKPGRPDDPFRGAGVSSPPMPSTVPTVVLQNITSTMATR